MKITIKTTEVNFSIDTTQESLTQFKNSRHETLTTIEFIALLFEKVERLHKEIVAAERRTGNEPS